MHAYDGRGGKGGGAARYTEPRLSSKHEGCGQDNARAKATPVRTVRTRKPRPIRKSVMTEPASSPIPVHRYGTANSAWRRGRKGKGAIIIII